MPEWFVWIFRICNEYAVDEWFVWIFRICVVIGIWILANNLKNILVCVRDINKKMNKLDEKYDALPSIDSFLSGIRSVSRHTIPDDSDEEL